MRLLAGSANRPLAERVASDLGTSLTRARTARFPDGEADVVVDPDLRGETVYLLQSTGPPVDANLVELLMLADAVRRCGAERVLAVVPYLGYARQDRRTDPGQPVGIRVVGDLLAAVGIDRVLAVDAHTRDLEAISTVPVEPATAVPLLVHTLVHRLPGPAVVVAPDLGAVKLAERYAGLLEAPVAIVRKTRLAGDEVRADEVVGEVADRHPVIVDDMISTGGTVVAAAEALSRTGAAGPVTIVATHGLFVGEATTHLGRLGLERLVVTDSLPPPDEPGLAVEVVSVAPLLADAIRRIEAGRRLDDLESFG